MMINVPVCVVVLQDAAVASGRQSFIDEYFGGEFETTYLFVTPQMCVLIMCLLECRNDI